MLRTTTPAVLSHHRDTTDRSTGQLQCKVRSILGDRPNQDKAALTHVQTLPAGGAEHLHGRHKALHGANAIQEGLRVVGVLHGHEAPAVHLQAEAPGVQERQQRLPHSKVEQGRERAALPDPGAMGHVLRHMPVDHGTGAGGPQQQPHPRQEASPKAQALEDREEEAAVHGVVSLEEVAERDHTVGSPLPQEVRQQLQELNVVANAAPGEEGSLASGRDRSHGPTHPGNQHPGQHAVVRVEQGDGPIAGWIMRVTRLGLDGDGPIQEARRNRRQRVARREQGRHDRGERPTQAPVHFHRQAIGPRHAAPPALANGPPYLGRRHRSRAERLGLPGGELGADPAGADAGGHGG